MEKQAIELLHNQIVSDIISNGDTTVLAEILENLPATVVYGSLSDKNQQILKQ